MAPKHRDWHPADVMAALRKTPEKWTLRGLSLARGYSANVVGQALQHPWPAVEQIIADALGVHPAQIWPSRYELDGTPKRRTAHPLRQPRTRDVSRRRIA